MMSPGGPVQAGPFPAGEESDFDLVEVSRVAPSIRIDLKYATSDNYAGRPMYENARCFARRGVAHKLANAQREFEAMGLSLLIWDLYRPRHVQYELWEATPDERYVADPDKGSNHNRGAAVDCTLVDREGNWLEMPSGFEDFTEKAHRSYEGGTPQQLRNRRLLEEVMYRHGFIGLPTEHWHFDCADAAGYEILDVPLRKIALELDRFAAEWPGVPYHPLSA